jgi:hypothetical protein
MPTGCGEVVDHWGILPRYEWRTGATW